MLLCYLYRTLNGATITSPEIKKITQRPVLYAKTFYRLQTVLSIARRCTKWKTLPWPHPRWFFLKSFCTNVLCSAPYRLLSVCDVFELLTSMNESDRRKAYSRKASAIQRRTNSLGEILWVFSSSQTRRIRGDMIESYKIITGKYQGCVALSLIKEAIYVTRGNSHVWSYGSDMTYVNLVFPIGWLIHGIVCLTALFLLIGLPLTHLA